MVTGKAREQQVDHQWSALIPPDGAKITPRHSLPAILLKEQKGDFVPGNDGLNDWYRRLFSLDGEACSW